MKHLLIGSISEEEFNFIKSVLGKLPTETRAFMIWERWNILASDETKWIGLSAAAEDKSAEKTPV